MLYFINFYKLLDSEFFARLADGPLLGFSLKNSRILRILAFLVTQLGVNPFLAGVLGLSVKAVKILTISVCPFFAAQ